MAEVVKRRRRTTSENENINEKFSWKNEGLKIRKAIFNALSYMIPLVAGGGMLIAVGTVWAIVSRGTDLQGGFATAFQGLSVNKIGTMAPDQMLFMLGKMGVYLVPAFLGGFIANSIAGKPGLAPGFILGQLAFNMNGSFLGGIIAGLLAGYIAEFCKQKIKMRGPFQTLLSFMVIPLITLVIGGLFYRFGIGLLIMKMMNGTIAWLNELNNKPEMRIALAAIMGGMQASDLGGPIGKTAVLFGIGIYDIANPMTLGPHTYNHIAIPVSTTALFFAYLLNKKYYNEIEKKNAVTNFTLGLFTITENGIPFMMAQPLIVIPSLIAGGATASALCAFFNIKLIPLLGFYLALPFVSINNGLIGLFQWILSFAGGVAVATILLTIGIRRKVKKLDGKALFFQGEDSGFSL